MNKNIKILIKKVAEKLVKVISDLPTVFVSFTSASFIFIFVFSAAILFFSLKSYAQFDASLSTAYRSAPQSFSADLDLGAAVVLWGRAPTNSGNNNNTRRPDPFYGYLRTQLTATAAPDYNGWGYEFQFFPLAFIGIAAGQSFAENEEDYTAYVCSIHLCIGDFREDYTEVRLAAAAGSFFFSASARSSKMREDNPSTHTTYVSPSHGLAVQSGSDDLKRTRIIAGYELSDRWSVLGMYLQARAETTKQESVHQLIGARYTNKTFSASLLGGTFEADEGIAAPVLEKQDLVTGVLLLRWTPLPGIALF